MKMQLMNETFRYDVLNNETVQKRNTYWNKIIYFIEIYNFKNSEKLHLCYPDAGRGPNSYAPRPTSFPNHHTVVGETQHNTLHVHCTLANSNLHQPLISFLYMISSCKQYWKDVQTWCKVWNPINTEFDY